jgi:transcriptional regulator of acetoin/glycerol metabolism
VRQLINIIERAKILADGHIITLMDLPIEIVHPSTTTGDVGEDGTLAGLQHARVVETLNRFHGNKTHAARNLGISRRSLYRLIDKFDIHPNPTSPPSE